MLSVSLLIDRRREEGGCWDEALLGLCDERRKRTKKKKKYERNYRNRHS